MGRGKERSQKLILRDIQKLIDRNGHFSYRGAMEFCKVGYIRLKRLVEKHKLQGKVRPYSGRRVHRRRRS